MTLNTLDNVVIVGGSVAGVHVAESLREADFDGTITIVDIEDHLPYDKPPLSKGFLSQDIDEDELFLRPLEWYQDNKVVLKKGRATSLDTIAKAVLLADGTKVFYDGLVLATGLSPRQGPPFLELSEHVHQIRSLQDGRNLRKKLSPGSHLAIVGGGFIGLEVASVAKQLGCSVTVIEKGAEPLGAAFGPQVGAWFREYHTARGIDFCTATHVVGAEQTTSAINLSLADGTVVSANNIVLGLGATPNTAWLQSSGIDLLEGGVLCDGCLRTNIKDIVVAGDIACWHNPLYGEHIRVEHWTNAVEQGRVAALALLGADCEPYIGPPYFWSDQFDALTRGVGHIRGYDEFAIVEKTEDSLVAIYGKGNKFTGALCVNNIAALLDYRILLERSADFSEALKVDVLN